MARKCARAFTLVELFVVVAIVGVLLGLLLPAIQTARESVRRLQCSHHLKQIGLALHHYESTFKKLPVGSWEGNFIGPLVTVLPYLEQGNTYQRWDQSLSYAHPYNRMVAGQKIDLYLCPSMTLNRQVPNVAVNEIGGPSSYLLCEGTDDYMPVADGIFGLHWPSFGYRNPNRRVCEIADGTSNTFFGGEAVYDYKDYLWPATTPTPYGGTIKWGTARWVVGYPAISLGTTLKPLNLHVRAALGGFASMHSGGGSNFVYADGSVRFLSQFVDGVTYHAAATRSGGETLAGMRD